MKSIDEYISKGWAPDAPQIDKEFGPGPRALFDTRLSELGIDPG